MKVNTYNKQATKPCFCIILKRIHWCCNYCHDNGEKEKSEMTLLPGGALVHFLELNVIIFVDESLLDVRDEIFHISVMRFYLVSLWVFAPKNTYQSLVLTTVPCNVIRYLQIDFNNRHLRCHILCEQLSKFAIQILYLKMFN